MRTTLDSPFIRDKFRIIKKINDRNSGNIYFSCLIKLSTWVAFAYHFYI